MQLIGMLDSPFVRRVAISFHSLGLPFTHQPLSVFSTYEQFREISPVVKAPSLICDDGQVLVDSTLILEYGERLAGKRTLMPTDFKEFQHTLWRVGHALAACEKSAQIYYETQLRPEERIHQPWVDRVTSQLLTAYDVLEADFVSNPPYEPGYAMDQGGITTAVAWFFTQQMIPGMVPVDRCPNLANYSDCAEALSEFRAAPYGSGTYAADF